MDRCLDAVQHAIERTRQARDLIRTPALGQSAAQSGQPSAVISSDTWAVGCSVIATRARRTVSLISARARVRKAATHVITNPKATVMAHTSRQRFGRRAVESILQTTDVGEAHACTDTPQLLYTTPEGLLPSRNLDVPARRARVRRAELRI